MGQLTKSVDIADGVDAWHRGLHAFVHLYASWAVLDTYVVEIQRSHVGNTSHSHQHHVALQTLELTLFLEVNTHGFTLVDSFGTSPQMERDATLLQRGAQTFGKVAVEGRQDFFHELHHFHFHTKTAEDAGKLDAYHAAANDAETLGK